MSSHRLDVSASATSSATPVRPERRKRSPSQMSPASETSSPPKSQAKYDSSPKYDPPSTENRMVELLAQALQPIHAKLENLEETQTYAEDQAEYFHSALARLSIENQSMQEQVRSLEQENRVLKQKVINLEASRTRLPLLNHLTKSITIHMYSLTLCTYSLALKICGLICCELNSVFCVFTAKVNICCMV